MPNIASRPGQTIVKPPKMISLLFLSLFFFITYIMEFKSCLGKGYMGVTLNLH